MSIYIDSKYLAKEYNRVAALHGLRFFSSNLQEDEDFFNMFDGCAFQ